MQQKAKYETKETLNLLEEGLEEIMTYLDRIGKDFVEYNKSMKHKRTNITKFRLIQIRSDCSSVFNIKKSINLRLVENIYNTFI